MESLDQRQKEYEEKKEELDDKLKNLKETIEAEQKKWTENLAQLNKVILEKEESHYPCLEWWTLIHYSFGI